MTKDKREKPVLRPSGARQLLEGGGKDLTDDERALLLALAAVDVEAGGSLDEQGRAALEELEKQVEHYDAEALTQAVKRMVTAKAREDRRMEWPELKRGKRK